jgi:phosphopantothenoylcysteine decarboxylase/phosphopantothenate--cysteine ligase
MILLAVTGSIAAYKAAEILRLFVKAGEDVHVIMTPAATHFVGPLTFQALSGHPVFSDPLDPQAAPMLHLDCAEKASVILVAPATADSLSRMAGGGAQDLVSAAVLAAPRRSTGQAAVPVVIAPAMHASMWLHPATQANVKTLKSYGYRFIGPEKGALGRAGDTGEGRMADPSVIVAQVLKLRAR